MSRDTRGGVAQFSRRLARIWNVQWPANRVARTNRLSPVAGSASVHCTSTDMTRSRGENGAGPGGGQVSFYSPARTPYRGRMIVLEADPSPVYALAFAPDGDRLVAGTKAGGVRFYGPFGPDPDAPASPQLGIPVTAVDHSPDGDWVATGTSVGWFARSSDGRAAGPLFQNRSQPRGVTAVKFVTPSLLAVGVGDRTRPASGGLEIWDVTTNKLREPRQSSADGVRAVSAVPHLRRVAWAEWGPAGGRLGLGQSGRDRHSPAPPAGGDRPQPGRRPGGGGGAVGRRGVRRGDQARSVSR